MTDMNAEPVVSMLDTDLYKLTMQQAVLQHYRDATVTYAFTNRSKNMKFNEDCVNKIRKHVDALSRLTLTPEEEAWLKRNCPYLRPAYVSYLASFRFRPSEQVNIEFIPDQEGDGCWGELKIEISGNWAEVILYEVPFMAIISETYFSCVDTRWSMRGQRALAKRKGQQLVAAGIRFSEFGTRRRRSFETQRLVIEGLLQGEVKEVSSSSASSAKGTLGKVVGTSNVLLAKMFDLAPVGTVAHEWTMGIAALEGYSHSNLRSLELWDTVYSPPSFEPNSPAHDLTIALTDTFSTRVFWQDLLSTSSGVEIAKRWRGLRQDSGDSKLFAKTAREEYVKLGIDPATKVIIYSDSLDVQRCIELAEYSKEIGIGASFGVGTHLTNDFIEVDDDDDDRGTDPDDTSLLDIRSERKPSKALNIVIKLASVNGNSAVKISDDLTKNTGDEEEIRTCKRRFGIVEGMVEHVEDA
ncbi:hypothetical protein CBS101457_004523 [Exobasidium rhododendri]|nr:hypothetical protein CBS101457_004523 [Exobasidium rhododendri]